MISKKVIDNHYWLAMYVDLTSSNKWTKTCCRKLFL
jgi:hypothetical protein